jgi:hypothetical protein
MSDNSEWIDAEAAMKMVEKILNGRGEAKRAIAECLRDGDIRSKASQFWVSKDRRVEDAWRKDAHKFDQGFDVEIKTRIFRASKQWGLDQEDWRWPANNFSIAHRKSPSIQRYMLSGMMLHRHDVEKVILRRNPTGVGSPGKPEQWTAFWFALIELEREGLLNAASYPSRAELRREVLSRINEGLSDKTIKPVISQVWTKFVEGRLPPEP